MSIVSEVRCEKLTAILISRSEYDVMLLIYRQAFVNTNGQRPLSLENIFVVTFYFLRRGMQLNIYSDISSFIVRKLSLPPSRTSVAINYRK